MCRGHQQPDVLSESRVLYVDADPATAEAVRESLEAADAPGFDCVVSALELPDVDGLGFLRSVRSEYQSVPFVLYPDAGSETVASEAISAGVTEYVPRADRTDHERLLEAIREAVETANREHFGSLFEHLPTAVVYGKIRPDGPVVERVNPAFEETFGYDTEEMIGENLDELIVPEGHRDGAVEINERLLAGERIHTEVRRLTPEGVRDFRLDVLGPEGTLEGYAIYTDVTESKRRQRELERQNERLEKFVSVVSHDLRSPLSVTKGNLELADEEYDDPRLTDAADAVDRMNALIGDLLTLAREGERVNDVEPVDLGGVAEDCWEGVRTEAAALETGSAPEIKADRSRVRQLLSNLLRNAVEHGSTSPPSHAQEDAVEHGGQDVTVTVGDLDRGFYVADDGPGIPEEERDRVFESGYTTAKEGTGFGLSIVAEIAEAHGWEIEVTESGDGGARFEVTGVALADG